MRHILRPTILIVVLSAAALCAGSLLQEAPAKVHRKVNPYAEDNAAIRSGEKLYVRECASCHGRAGEGVGTRPPLASRSVADASPGAVEWVIRSGSSRRGMPSFSHLPEPQRWQIAAYLKQLSAPAATRDRKPPLRPDDR